MMILIHWLNIRTQGSIFVVVNMMVMLLILMMIAIDLMTMTMTMDHFSLPVVAVDVGVVSV